MNLQQDVIGYATRNEKISPKEMIKELLPKHYPVSDIVLDAAVYFTEIIRRKEFCVEQDKLNKYGILSNDIDKDIPKSNNIKRLLDQYNLKEKRDYLQLKNELKLPSGTKHTIQYTLTPKAFFLCLVRSKNSFEYAAYYFHVLEIYDYYEDYYKAKQEDTISELCNLTREQIKECKILQAKLDKEAEHSKLLQDKLDKLSEETREQLKDNKVLQNQLSDLQITMNRIVDKLDTCTEYPNDDKKAERFVIMKNNEDVYCVIRRQKKSLSGAVKEQEKKGYSKLQGIIESETIYLWNVIKDELIKDRKITTKYNSFKLNMPEEDLVTLIKGVFNRRKNY